MYFSMRVTYGADYNIFPLNLSRWYYLRWYHRSFDGFGSDHRNRNEKTIENFSSSNVEVDGKKVELVRDDLKWDRFLIS